MKNLLLALVLLSPLVAFAAPPPPILRQALTTNAATGTFTNGQVPTWNGTTWAPGNGGELGILRVNGGGINTTITNLFLGTNSSLHRVNGGNARGVTAVDFQQYTTNPIHVASGFGSYIGPGSLYGIASGNYSVLLNGFHNTVTGERSLVMSGQDNTNDAPFSFLGGVNCSTPASSSGNLFVWGTRNYAKDQATDSGIISGSDHVLGGLITDSFIVGGYSHTNMDSSEAFMGGGSINLITNSTQAGIVGGGGHRVYNSIGAFTGGGTQNTLSNAPGSFAFGSSAMVRSGNSGVLGPNLTNDVDGTVSMGNGELGNKFHVDKTNAWLVGSLKLKQTNANAVAIETAGSIVLNGTGTGLINLLGTNGIDGVTLQANDNGRQLSVSGGIVAAVSNIASAAAITIDLDGPNVINMTNPIAHNVTFTFANAVPASGKYKWFSLRIPGSGGVTNNTLTWAGATAVNLEWLAKSTNSTVTSNLVNVTSGAVYGTIPTTNVTMSFKQ